MLISWLYLDSVFEGEIKEYQKTLLNTKDISFQTCLHFFCFHVDSQMLLSHASNYLPLLNCINISTMYIKSEK